MKLNSVEEAWAVLEAVAGTYIPKPMESQPVKEKVGPRKCWIVQRIDGSKPTGVDEPQVFLNPSDALEAYTEYVRNDLAHALDRVWLKLNERVMSDMNMAYYEGWYSETSDEGSGPKMSFEDFFEHYWEIVAPNTTVLFVYAKWKQSKGFNGRWVTVEASLEG